MPTFTFKNKKTGKTYTVRGPEGGTREQAYAKLQAQLEPQQGPAGGAAPATYPGAAGMIAGQTPTAPAAAAPKSDLFSGVTSRVIEPPKQTDLDVLLTGGIDPVIAQMKERLPKEGVLGHLSRGAIRQAELAGGGLESIASNIRGARQRFTEDPEKAAQLEQEEKLSRLRQEQGGGYRQAGKTAADIATWLVPASRVNMLTKGAPLLPAVMTEGALGATQASLQPTVGEDESATENAGWGALFGGALPAVARGKIGDVLEQLPFFGGIGTKRARELRKLEDEAKRVNVTNRNIVTDERKAAKDAADRANDMIVAQRQQQAQKIAAEKSQFPVQKKQTLREIGKGIEADVAGTKIPVSEARVRALRSIQRRFGNELPPEFTRNLEQMELASKHGYIPGTLAHQAKSAFGSAARSGKYNSTALYEAERVMSDTLMEGLPKARADALLGKYRDYDITINAKYKPPVLPVTPKVRATPVPRRPIVTAEDLRPPATFTGSPVKRALIRSALLRPEEDPEGGF